MKDLVRIDACIYQCMVLFLGHRENEPMGDHGTFRRRRKFGEMLLPGFGDALLALGVGELRGRCAGPVRIDSDGVMEESAGVHLSKRFLRRVVGEVLELFADLLVHLGALAKGNFAAGCFVEIIQIQFASGGGLVGKDLAVLHVRDSRR